jgi:hypothetical protein
MTGRGFRWLCRGDPSSHFCPESGTDQNRLPSEGLLSKMSRLVLSRSVWKNRADRKFKRPFGATAPAAPNAPRRRPRLAHTSSPAPSTARLPRRSVPEPGGARRGATLAGAGPASQDGGGSRLRGALGGRPREGRLGKAGGELYIGALLHASTSFIAYGCSVSIKPRSCNRYQTLRPNGVRDERYPDLRQSPAGGATPKPRGAAQWSREPCER